MVSQSTKKTVLAQRNASVFEHQVNSPKPENRFSWLTWMASPSAKQKQRLAWSLVFAVSREA